MAVEKLSISFEPELAHQLREEARSSGRSVSALVAEAVERNLRLARGRRLIAEWEAEHGPITEAELEEVRARWPV